MVHRNLGVKNPRVGRGTRSFRRSPLGSDGKDRDEYYEYSSSMCSCEDGDR